MTLTWASTWDGHEFTRWPVVPPPPCTSCGQPGRPYLAGQLCDTHRPWPPPPPAYPIGKPGVVLGSALEHAVTAWPRARRCTSGDKGRACPFPLDPALGDAVDHPSCSPTGQLAVEAARHADTLRGTAAARAAVTDRTGAAA